MFTFLSAPTMLIRLLVVAVILAVAVLYVLPRHRGAGLLLAMAAALDLVVSLAIPLLEVAGLGYMVTQVPAPTPVNPPPPGNSPPDSVGWIVGAMLLVPQIPPLAQAFNLGCFLVSIVLLTQRVAKVSRED